MPFSDAFELIEGLKFRSPLIYHARLLFWSDGDFAAQEKHILQKQQDHVRGAVDVHAAVQEVETVTINFHKRMREEKAAEEAKKSSLERFLDAILFWDTNR